MRLVALCLLAACGRIEFDAIGSDAPAIRLSLYDPAIDTTFADVSNGGMVDITGRRKGVAIIAEVTGTAGSVEFIRNGEVHVEETLPFTSAGDDAPTVHADIYLFVGPNTVAVTAYELAGASGAPIASVNVSIELALPLSELAIAHIGIIDDNNDNASFIEITDSSTLSLATLPTDADIRVDTTPDFIGSVVVTSNLLSEPRVENHLPYTAFGSYSSFTPALGTYTLTATPYSLGNARGEVGPASTVNFEIVP